MFPIRRVATFLLLLSFAVLLCSCGAGENDTVSRQSSRGIGESRNVTVGQAAEMIRAGQGNVRVVLLYGAFCPASREMFPDFVARAEVWRGRDVEVLAFSTDDQESSWRKYLDSRSLPFEKVRILPWRPGQLDAAFRPTGIHIGKTFGTPLIAVVDRDGRVIGQHSGVRGAEFAQEWLRSAGISIK